MSIDGHGWLPMRIREMVLGGEWRLLAARVRELFGVDVGAGELARVCCRCLPHDIELRRGCLGPKGQESTWELWLKNRLDDIHVPLARQGGAPDAQEVVSARLHIFFIWLDETDEMLTRLRRDERPGRPGEPSRSRIGKTNEIIRPIDRVALRVAPPPTEDQS